MSKYPCSLRRPVLPPPEGVGIGIVGLGVADILGAGGRVTDSKVGAGEGEKESVAFVEGGSIAAVGARVGELVGMTFTEGTVLSPRVGAGVGEVGEVGARVSSTLWTSHIHCQGGGREDGSEMDGQ